MKRIQLTQGKFALVDDADFEWLNQWLWHVADKDKDNSCYAIRHLGRTKIGMHRVIMQAPKNRQVDHRDGNGLNNCRNNLRMCTHSENLQNQRMQKGRASR